MNRDRLFSQLYAFVTVAMWSGAYVVTKISLQHFTAGPLGLLRCGLAAICLMTLLIWRRQLTVSLRDIPVFVLSGACGFALYFLAFNTGSLSVNPTTGSVIIALCPVFTSLLAQRVFREKLTVRKWLATAVAFSGVLVMLLWEGSLQMSRGVIWMLGAAVLLSIYNLLQRGLASRFSPLQITAWSFLFGTLLLSGSLPEALLGIRDAPPLHLLLVVFLGVFPGALAYVTWSRALAIAEQTSQVTNWMFVTPFMALLLEYGVTGQFPGVATFVGGGIIISALVCFFWSIPGAGEK
ncbi:DMT family transporter [Entomohabitans teleogrylli]|uniref:DMT family transporter n=1 Tax=Entomohabitans teleogrylli TaxID=1384589 RepID=UPI00073D50DF|nr:DMT family transporter [Entomohabitans teleogrylli]